METDIQHPENRSRHQLNGQPTFLLLAIAAVAISLVLATVFWQQGREAAAHQFRDQQRPAFESVVDALDHSAMVAEQLARVMAVAANDRNSLFNALAGEIVSRTSYLDLAGWIEPASNRQGADFHLRAIQAAGNTVDVNNGGTLLTEAHRETLLRAAATGQRMTADGPVLLPGPNGMGSGQLLFQPLHRGDGTLDGLVVVAVRFDALVDTLIDPASVRLHLFEVQPDNGRNLPLYNGPRGASTGDATPTASTLEGQPHLHREIRVANRVWSTWLVPAQPLPMRWKAEHWLPLAALLSLALGLNCLAHGRGRAHQAMKARYVAREQLLGELRGGREQLKREVQQLRQQLRSAQIEAQASVSEVRQQQQSNEELEANAWLYQHAFDDAATGMALFDPITGVCVRANRAFSEMLGYSGGELAGLDFREITHPADVHITPRLVRSALRGGPDRFTVEKRYLHRSGRVVCCMVAGTLLRDRHGSPLYLAVQAQDISAHRTEQTQLPPERAISSPH